MSYRKSISLLLFILTTMNLSGQSHYTISLADFNTPRSKELAPAFFRNGLVFCSDRRNDFLVSYTDYENNPLTNLYFAEQKKSGKFETPRLLAKELTTVMFEGPSCFSRDGNVIYFSRTIGASSGSRSRSRGDTTFGIFISRLVNEKWTRPEVFRYNSASYNTGYPFISDDGSMLFFCSDKPGGMGGFDIYVSTLNGNTWNEPENLGPNVNTPSNEVFPFLQKDGRLYFASRGHNTIGDLDIYFTLKKDGIWQKPVRLDEPFNTAKDDYGLIFNATSDTAYFVSDRNGSADIFAAYSSIPTFAGCEEQQENDYCFVFYESNNDEVDTEAYAYEWDLGDGTKITALEAEHCFAEPGNYIVQLNIIDKLTKEFLVSQATYNFVVEKIEQPYISAPDTVTAGQITILNGYETYIRDFNAENYYWDFGDGSRSIGVATSHTYKYPGTYNIILGVTGQYTDPSKHVKNNCISRRIVVLEPKK